MELMQGRGPWQLQPHSVIEAEFKQLLEKPNFNLTFNSFVLGIVSNKVSLTILKPSPVTFFMITNIREKCLFCKTNNCFFFLFIIIHNCLYLIGWLGREAEPSVSLKRPVTLKAMTLPMAKVTSKVKVPKSWQVLEQEQMSNQHVRPKQPPYLGNSFKNETILSGP